MIFEGPFQLKLFCDSKNSTRTNAAFSTKQLLCNKNQIWSGFSATCLRTYACRRADAESSSSFGSLQWMDWSFTALGLRAIRWSYGVLLQKPQVWNTAFGYGSVLPSVFWDWLCSTCRCLLFSGSVLLHSYCQELHLAFVKWTYVELFRSMVSWKLDQMS